MNEDLDLQERYGDEAVCGYVRDPMYDEQRNKITGTCAITNNRCKRSVPMDMHHCRVYENLLSIIELRSLEESMKKNK